jgi:N-sulfoglucosamine sulfohydrolase
MRVSGRAGFMPEARLTPAPLQAGRPPSIRVCGRGTGHFWLSVFIRAALTSIFMKLRFLLIILPLLAGFARAAEPSRPNVLFVFADDWGCYAGTYARVQNRPSLNQIVKTPNMDAVAARGVIFRNAFVNAPSCTPCRSSLMTGRYFFRTGRGSILHGSPWDATLPAWPLLMQASGYHLGETGKVWGPGQPNDAPIGGGKFAYEKRGMKFNNFSENATRRVQAGVAVEDAKAELLTEVRENFNDFLTARPADQPFCYVFGPTHVHRAWEKGSGKALWGINPDDLQGKLPSFVPDVPEIRQDVADGLGEIQALDAMLGVLLARLRETGMLEQTLIVLSGDHGMPGMPRGKCNLYDFGTQVPLIMAGPGVARVPGGRVADDFTLLMDLAPTFLELAKVPLPPGMDGRSLLTVLQHPQNGTADPVRTDVVTGRERHVQDARPGNLPYPQRALRNKDFLYIRNFEPDRWPMGDPGQLTDSSTPAAALLEENTMVAFSDLDASPTKAWMIQNRHDSSWQQAWNLAFAKRPAEELYDLAKDPDQMNNVAADPAYATARATAAARLDEVLTKAGDPRVAPPPILFENAPYTDGRLGPKPKKKP